MSERSLSRLGGRQRRLAAAQRAYGTLPQAQRRVLVLRYVDGLPTPAVARRLGLDEAEVEELLAAGRAALLRTPAKPFLRPLAAAAALAAVALTLPHAITPDAGPAQAGALPDGGGVTYVVGGDPVVLVSGSSEVPVAIPAPRAPRAQAALSVTPPRGDDVRVPPRAGCRSLCLPRTPKSGDSVRVAVPTELRETVGTSELAFEQEHVPLCSAMPSAPNAMARCVPGST